MKTLWILAVTVSLACAASATEQGKASFYTAKEHRTTASGERFDPTDHTAAHRTLPFNTQVKVTRTDTGQSTQVRINNRGPYKKGRVIDLSPVAADDLQMKKKGVAPVKVEVVAPAK